MCVVPTGALLQLGSTHGPGPGLVVAHLATPGTSTAQHSTWPLHDASWVHTLGGSSHYNVMRGGRGQHHHRYSPLQCQILHQMMVMGVSEQLSSSLKHGKIGV